MDDAAGWQRPLKRFANALHKWRITPDQATLLGFLDRHDRPATVSLGALWSRLTRHCAQSHRRRRGRCISTDSGRTSEAGGFLDIGLDFVFYAAVVLGFALANPAQNALAATLLLFAFIGTGTSFLAFAIAAKQKSLTRPNFPNKAFYYLEGSTEGTETVLALVVFCLFPGHFSTLATLFASACLVTTATRLWGGYWTLRRHEANER